MTTEATIVELMKAGCSPEEILKLYPYLGPTNIDEALTYAHPLHRPRNKPKCQCRSSKGGITKRVEVLSLPNERRENLQRRFCVKRLGVFGLALRDEMQEGSDIDVLV
jgi:hypothetical protein